MAQTASGQAPPQSPKDRSAMTPEAEMALFKKKRKNVKIIGVTARSEK
jgi:hypothetical protein